jgi:hypothetical protein
MPRKIRRLVGVLKIVGLRIAVEVPVGARVVEEDQLARARGGPSPRCVSNRLSQ